LFLVWWEEYVKDRVFGVAVVFISKHKSARKNKAATQKNSAFKTNNFLRFITKSSEDNSNRSKYMEWIMQLFKVQ
jgi:hypothetical protein